MKADIVILSHLIGDLVNVLTVRITSESQQLSRSLLKKKVTKGKKKNMIGEMHGSAICDPELGAEAGYCRGLLLSATNHA